MVVCYYTLKNGSWGVATIHEPLPTIRNGHPLGWLSILYQNGKKCQGIFLEIASVKQTTFLSGHILLYDFCPDNHSL